MTKSPQLENGYTNISNELLDALCRMELASYEQRVLWAIFRKTYGYHKKQESISYNQLAEATGLSRRMVIYAIQNLQAKQMITVIRDSTHSNKIGIQKDYDRWKTNAVCESWKSQLGKKRTDYHKKLVQTPSTSTCADGVHQLSKETSEDTVHQTSVDTLHQLAQSTSEDTVHQTSVDTLHQLAQSTSEDSLHPQKKRIEYNDEIIPKETINIIINNKKKSTRARARVTSLDEKTGKEIYRLPDYVDDNTWNDYLAMRKKKRATPTERAIKLIIKDLEKFHGEGYDVNKLLELSIKNSWTGVFPRKEFLRDARTGTNSRELPKVYTRPDEL